MSNIENSICEAIELIVNKSITEAGYDKTIQATIHSCADATIGKYKVKYQDSSFYAYATTADVTYVPGSVVYILIPGNDMNKDKTILGTVEKLGINYVAQAEKDELFDTIGTNCITSKSNYKLSSYMEPNKLIDDPKNATYLETIAYYDEDSKSYKGNLNINAEALNQYIKESSSLICGAEFKTSLPQEQQYQGNYGIIFGIDFYDNANGNDLGQIVTRYYTVDVDNMTGNPYKLNLGKRQYEIFNIDGANFNKISSISIFVNNFPNKKNFEEIVAKNLFDIQISNIELSGAVLMTESERNGCGLSFYTPEGSFFSGTATKDATLRLTAKVKIKGKMVDSLFQKIPFYWFKEDASVTFNSNYYNKYGGRGWRCLNKYNFISQTPGEPRQVEWIADKDTYIVSINDIKTEQSKYKCVIIYDGAIYSKTIIIKNLKNSVVLSIESDLGKQFYYDMGRPTLTCYVNKKNDLPYIKPLNYKYIWAKEDEQGILFNLPVDYEKNLLYNAEYKKAENRLSILNQQLEKGEVLLSEVKNEIAQLEDTLKTFDEIQWIDDNQIRNVAVNEITNFAIYKCSVFDANDVFIGTTSIKLANSLKIEDTYSLIINNGTQMFKYNEYGVSPTNKSLDHPIEIPTLTFSIFDNLGRSLDKKALSHCDITWKVPIKNTMLTNLYGNGKPGATDAAQEYQYYKNSTELVYKIQDKYFYNYKNNDIELTVNYKGMNLTTKTNLTFVKEGEAGTNGTEYICKIVPNTKYPFVDIPLFRTIKNDTKGGHFNFSYLQDNGNQTSFIGNDFSNGSPFVAKLYKSGEEIFSGAKDGFISQYPDGEKVPVIIEWSFLANQYNSKVKDAQDLTIDKKSGTIKYEGKLKDNVAHILKCTIYYSNNIIYATLPIITSEVNNSNYIIKLKENTGFQSVIYTSDGIMPKYDTTKPFEIEVYRKEFGFAPDKVSMSPNPQYGINEFEWEVQGQYYSFYDKQMIPSNDLINQDSSIYTKDLKANQRYFKPNVKYDGLCVTNAIKCKCSAGFIHIPIHFLLNKYGLSYLNGWDGNSVQINKDGGFILSPQMGAGIKENDNSFTGVLMGKVQEPNRRTSDMGVLGFHKGTRTFKLDSETGSAIFGAGQGQIIIDPKVERALIYSHNYFEDKNYGEDGLPIDYTNHANKGMMIDLGDKPEIRFGSGNFIVDSDGHVTAKGGGIIAGWNIDDTALFTKSKNDSQNVQIDSADFTRKINGVDRDSLRLALGNKFAVSKDGTMYAGDAIIGTGSNKITIGKDQQDNVSSAIYSGNKNSYLNNSQGFYLGTNGFYLGTNFWVKPSGEMFAKAGEVGEFNIQNGHLSTNGKTWSNKDESGKYKEGVYIGSEGISLGNDFWVSKNGYLETKKGKIANWNISENCLYTNNKNSWTTPGVGIYLGSEGFYLGDNFWVKSDGTMEAINGIFSGKITANEGEIAGWKVDANSFTKNAGTSTSVGMSSGYWAFWAGQDNFTVTNSGIVTCKNINITGGTMTGGNITGGSISGGASVQGGTLVNGTVGYGKFDNGVAAWVGNIAANQITANKINTIYGQGELLIVTNFLVKHHLKVSSGTSTFTGQTENIKIGNRMLTFINGVFCGSQTI